MTRQRGSRGDAGAILVHVAAAILAVMSVTTLVIDYGVYWESRRQIQNAADAGALAGAIALAYENTTDLSASGPAAQAAATSATANLVWGQPPSVLDSDLVLQSGFGVCPAPNVDGSCVRVDAHRTADRANPLPTFFGALVGLASQDVRATATAQVIAANASNCVRPMAVADKWIESAGVWSSTETYNPASDTYTAPNASSPGTSFTVASDFGSELVLNTGMTGSQINAGWFQPVRASGTVGSVAYESALRECMTESYRIGDDMLREDGVTASNTLAGAQQIVDLDPAATWNPSTQSIDGSCWVSGSCSDPYAKQSPRIVTVPVFDLGVYMSSGGPGNGDVVIVNFLALFIVVEASEVRGIVVKAPGTVDDEGGHVANPWAFLKVTALVR